MSNSYIAIGAALITVGLVLAVRRRKLAASGGGKSGQLASILFVIAGAIFIGVARFGL